MRLEVSPDVFGGLLRAMFGPTLPDPKTPEESEWEGEGGALTVRCEGSEHTYGPAL